MKSRPIVINEAVRKDIDRVKKFAEEHRYDLANMTFRALSARGISGTSCGTPPGDIPGHCLMIPMGFRVVYSIEQHPPGWMHHFSVSTSDAGRTVNEFGLRLIADEFGLTGRKFDNLWKEDIAPNRIAINALIRYEDPKNTGGEVGGVAESKYGKETPVECGDVQSSPAHNPNPGRD